MEEWKKPQCGPIIDRNTVYISHSGKFIKLKNTEDGQMQAEEPSQLRGHHGEADTFIVFHSKNMVDRRKAVRLSDTFIFVIHLGKEYRSTVLGITDDEKQHEFTEALIDLHSLRFSFSITLPCL